MATPKKPTGSMAMVGVTPNQPTRSMKIFGVTLTQPIESMTVPSVTHIQPIDKSMEIPSVTHIQPIESMEMPGLIPIQPTSSMTMPGVTPTQQTLTVGMPSETPPSLEFMKQRLEMMASTMETSGHTLSPQMRAQLDYGIKNLLRRKSGSLGVISLFPPLTVGATFSVTSSCLVVQELRVPPEHSNKLKIDELRVMAIVPHTI
ncbi:hypothetical protein JHK82_055541 [Glycine max]|nr:hypothetical protein JHK82_055541 [Glycine max]